MKKPLRINDEISIATYELVFSFARSSGKGGQNVNKVNSKAILYWSPSQCSSLTAPMKQRFLLKFGHLLTVEGLMQIQSERYRDQPQNIDDALEKLRDMILSILAPPKKRRPTKPTRSSREKRMDTKKHRGKTKALRGRVD